MIKGDTVVGVCLAIAMYVVPSSIFLMVAERAETMGHTNLSHAVAWDAVNPGDNYSVFRKSREIYIITGLAPRRIIERNGRITTVHTVMNRINPVRTYSSATPDEKALWRKHFS